MDFLYSKRGFWAAWWIFGRICMDSEAAAYGLALPYALADEDGRIVWANDEFQAVTALEKGKWKNLLSMFPEATKDDLATDEDPVKGPHGVW